jgi:Flp pilus assembly protein TadG
MRKLMVDGGSSSSVSASGHRAFRVLRSAAYRRLCSTGGGALIEVALAFPLVLCLLTAIFWFSTALFQKLELANAVEIGGRFLAADRGDNDPCKSTTSEILAAAPGLNSSKISLTITLNGTATGPAASPSCAGASGQANSNMVVGGTAEIQASYPCTLIFFPVFSTGFTTTCKVHSTLTEIVQ